jgi:hypothetical protein
MKPTLLTKSQHYITQPAWLPMMAGYVSCGSWQDMRVEATSAKVCASEQNTYQFNEKTNEYCFLKQDNTGDYYVCDESCIAGWVYPSSLVLHALGAVGVMVLDILAIVYRVLQLPYNLLTANFMGVLVNTQQVGLRVLNCAIKPLQWTGLVLSVLLGVWYPNSRDKIYASLERDMYLGVFSLGPVAPVVRQVEGEEPSISELVDLANEIYSKMFPGVFPHYRYTASMHAVGAQSMSQKLRKNIGLMSLFEDKTLRDTLSQNVLTMKEGDTLEQSQVRMIPS